MSNISNRIILFLQKNLRYNILIMIILFLLLQMVVLYISFNIFFSEFYIRKLGEKATNLSFTLSKNELIISSVKNRVFNLQAYIEDIRKELRCSYIVIADNNGIRFTHPDQKKIGQKFTGDDYYDAIKLKKTYYSEAIGSLGPSIRGFSPIIYNSEVIGFVAVGYLKENITNELKRYKNLLITFLFFMCFLGIIFSNYITQKIKKLTYGLEPLQIAKLYKENNAILNSIKEGVISIDENLKIKYNNIASLKICEKIGINIESLVDIFTSNFGKSDNYGIIDQLELNINDNSIIYSSQAIFMDNVIIGFLLHFYEKNESESLKKEISHIKKCTEILRSQSHEYSNKLHLINGLLQIEAYEEAKNLILKESESVHNVLDFIEQKIYDNHIKGLLVGKYSISNSLGCKIDFNTESFGWRFFLKEVFHISTIVSNIIQNAIEASLSNPFPRVLITIYEDNDNIILEVEDNGEGIRDKEIIFEKGYSTKSDPNRGLGLYNVRSSVNKLKGKIEIGVSQKLGGALFKITLPKSEVCLT